MDYASLVDGAQRLGFIEDRERAGTAVDTVLAGLARRLGERHAYRMAEALPGQVPFERLWRQAAAQEIGPADAWLAATAARLGISRRDARTLATSVLGALHGALRADTQHAIRDALPWDWAALLPGDARAGGLLDELRAENVRILRLAQLLEASSAGRPEERAARLGELAARIGGKRATERDLLEPLLDGAHDVRAEALAVRALAQDVERDVASLRRVPPDARGFQPLAEVLHGALQELVAREEDGLFPAAERTIHPETQLRLGAAAAARRRHASEVARSEAELRSFETRPAPGSQAARSQADERIARAVLRALHAEPRVDVSAMRVNVDRARVELRGSVESERACHAARVAASRVWGVREVTLRLAVRHADPLPSPRDPATRVTVELALLGDPEIAAEDLRVEVRAGIATLEGTVDRLEKRRHAGEVAARQQGVLGVANRLAVVPSCKVDDQDLAVSIADAIVRHPGVSAEDVTVIVAEGVVTLRGRVPSAEALRAVQRAVEGAEGVREVEEAIEVVPPPGAGG
jgi:osmotically-inducible protein OsmY/uncharacterized protein (DUF2267 family)